MPIELRDVSIPDFGLPESPPEVPASTYEARCERAYETSGCDWLVVYADREHFANIMFLSGFEPRFEEALLLLGPRSRRILVVGIECFGYAGIANLPGLETIMCPSFSLMGLDRPGPNLPNLLKDAGIGGKQRIGLIGWKYFQSNEWPGTKAGFFAPSFLVDAIVCLIGDGGELIDTTRILMHPEKGMRAAVDADQIALAEWGASRGSAAMWRIVSNLCEGDSELLAASRMGYAGEPMNAHVMVSSAVAGSPVMGLRSPTGRRFRRGDSGVAATSFWGGLSARAGLIDTINDGFLQVACRYMEAILKWYSVADVGVSGGQLFQSVTETLASAGLKSALNPGHISGHDEWMHTPIRQGSAETIASGSLFQVDISPTPLADGWALSCIDSVAFADETLREELRYRHPKAFHRMQARRAFMRDELGITLKESIQPLSSVPSCFPPFWLNPGRLLVAA
jgi:hypothetical protein